MSAWHATVRLWFFGSIFWIAFWAWNYGTKCKHLIDGSLWCPTTAGPGVSPTNYYHMAFVVLGPPLSACILGLLCVRAFNAMSQRRKYN